MNPNALPQHEAHHDIIEDFDYLPPMSNNERKRLMAREHNRAYEAGELNRPIDLKEIVRGTVRHATKSLDI